jgi:uroporphyrinogen-III synthase
MVKTSLPLVLLTRPRAAAERFAALLLAERPELDVLISPIMEIVYLVPERLPAADVVLFTSVHGVAGYVAAGGTPSEAYCVGAVTAEKARKAGFDVLQVAPDLAALRPALAGEQRELLQVRGTYVTADLVAEFAHVASVIVYDQPRVGLGDQAVAALASGRAVVVPLFSPRSARAFAKEAGQPRALYAAYISAAVQAAAELPFIEAETAQTPDARGMVAATLRLIDKV